MDVSPILVLSFGHYPAAAAAHSINLCTGMFGLNLLHRALMKMKSAPVCRLTSIRLTRRRKMGGPALGVMCPCISIPLNWFFMVFMMVASFFIISSGVSPSLGGLK